MNTLAIHTPTLDHSTMPDLQLSPRLINRQLNIIRHAVSIIEKQKGYVTNTAVAEYLGVSVDEYNHILKDANSYRLFHHSQEVA